MRPGAGLTARDRSRRGHPPLARLPSAQRGRPVASIQRRRRDDGPRRPPSTCTVANASSTCAAPPSGRPRSGHGYVYPLPRGGSAWRGAVRAVSGGKTRWPGGAVRAVQHRASVVGPCWASAVRLRCVASRHARADRKGNTLKLEDVTNGASLAGVEPSSDRRARRPRQAVARRALREARRAHVAPAAHDGDAAQRQGGGFSALPLPPRRGSLLRKAPRRRARGRHVGPHAPHGQGGARQVRQDAALPRAPRLRRPQERGDPPARLPALHPLFEGKP